MFLFKEFKRGLSILMIMFLFISCNHTKNGKIENSVWRSINNEILSIDDAFWGDYYSGKAVGPRFWQIEFFDTLATEYISYGYNVLHQKIIKYVINADTLILYYPRDYVFDEFSGGVEYLREYSEKYQIDIKNDTLLLELLSFKYSSNNDEHFSDEKISHRFVRPINKLEFPEHLSQAPKTKQQIFDILDNLYSECGKKKLFQHFDNIPEKEEDFSSYGIRRSIIFSDLIRVFDIENNPVFQEMFDHYHPEVIAGRIIGHYLDYLRESPKQNRLYFPDSGQKEKMWSKFVI